MESLEPRTLLQVRESENGYWYAFDGATNEPLGRVQKVLYPREGKRRIVLEDGTEPEYSELFIEHFRKRSDAPSP